MCAVSMIVGYMQEHLQPESWGRSDFDSLQDILRRLEKLDTRLGQPDCIDPGKAKYLREIEERLDRLEARGGRS